MYLPLAFSFLRFFQLPLSEQPGQSPRDLAVLSPYHDAPNIHGISVDLPDDCTVDQVIVLHRHGSRGPEFEDKFIQRLVETLDRSRDVIQAASLPPNLQFLKQGYGYDVVPKQLTAIGRREVFNHGVDFSLRYPNFLTDTVVSSPVQRVVDSSYFFTQGLFGSEAGNVTIRTELDDPVSWVMSWKACPKFSTSKAHKAATEWATKYVLPITHRLNKLIPGINLSLNDTRGALYACPFDLATYGNSPWCDVFSAQELKDLEYEYDLLMDGITGHASEGDLGPFLGAFYVQKLIERLRNATGDAQRLHLEFGHDTSMLLPLSTMGLNKDTLPLDPQHAPAHRKFRTSHQAPFAASMIWERFTCRNSFQGPQVRLVLNGATFPLSICQKSREDRKYGTCSVDGFARANEYSLSVQYKSESWNKTCELTES